MQNRFSAVLLGLCSFAFITGASAASLQIAPVSVEVPAPGAAATLSLRNEAQKPLAAQVRIFRWTQQNGVERLEPTNDVVASPPSVSLAAKQNYSLRIIRTTGGAVRSAESYRLLIDELPHPARQRTGAVTLVLRYSVPVFFAGPQDAPPQVAWSIERRGGKIAVVARNTGDRHLRVSALKLRDASGATMSFGSGLTGYVLGRSTMQWTAPGRTSGFGSGGSAVISAQSDLGPVNATATVQK